LLLGRTCANRNIPTEGKVSTKSFFGTVLPQVPRSGNMERNIGLSMYAFTVSGLVLVPFWGGDVEI